MRLRLRRLYVPRSGDVVEFERPDDAEIVGIEWDREVVVIDLLERAHNDGSGAGGSDA